MSDKKIGIKFYDTRDEIKDEIKAIILKLYCLAQDEEFETAKESYKDKVFDAMKKLTNIKDEL